MAQDTVWRVAAVAQLFGVHANTVRGWERRGWLPRRRGQINGYREWTVAELMASVPVIFASLGQMKATLDLRAVELRVWAALRAAADADGRTSGS